MYKHLVHQWASSEIARLQAELAPGLQVGDTVCITGDECNGLVGELKVIDGRLDEGYGVQFDDVAGYVFFRGDELSKVDMIVEMDGLPF